MADVDIVERLRFFATQTTVSFPGYMSDAADEVEKLRREVAYRLEAWQGADKDRNELQRRLSSLDKSLEQALRDVRQARAVMETSNGYVTVGRRLHDIEKILSGVVERLVRICDECELPVDSEPHLQHCPEAIRG